MNAYPEYNQVIQRSFQVVEDGYLAEINIFTNECAQNCLDAINLKGEISTIYDGRKITINEGPCNDGDTCVNGHCQEIPAEP